MNKHTYLEIIVSMPKQTIELGGGLRKITLNKTSYLNPVYLHFYQYINSDIKQKIINYLMNEILSKCADEYEFDVDRIITDPSIRTVERIVPQKYQPITFSIKNNQIIKNNIYLRKENK